MSLKCLSLYDIGWVWQSPCHVYGLTDCQSFLAEVSVIFWHFHSFLQRPWTLSTKALTKKCELCVLNCKNLHTQKAGHTFPCSRSAWECSPKDELHHMIQIWQIWNSGFFWTQGSQLCNLCNAPGRFITSAMEVMFLPGVDLFVC